MTCRHNWIRTVGIDPQPRLIVSIVTQTCGICGECRCEARLPVRRDGSIPLDQYRQYVAVLPVSRWARLRAWRRRHEIAADLIALAVVLGFGAVLCALLGAALGY